MDIYINAAVYMFCFRTYLRRPSKMSSRSIRPPWEYLQQATVPALQSFELSRLNHASNLKKEIDTLLEQWLDETSAAMLARFLMEQSLTPEQTPVPNVSKHLHATPQEGQARALVRSRSR
jgi:hypothetical protein